MNVVAFDRRDDEIDQAVREEDVVAGFDFLGQVLVAHGGNGFIAFDVAGCQGKFMAFDELYRAVFEEAQADFRPLRIEHEGDGNVEVARYVAYHFDALFMFCMGSMGEIKAGDVHAGLNHFCQDIRRIRARAQGTYDFCLFIHR